MPTFGKDTIRRFVTNVSEMKQFAARDFEDLLQCAIPAFEGLLPEPHNRHVMALLFIFAEWHGLAKLRLHTDHTLTLLECQTVSLGEAMRRFVNETCTAIATSELKREYQARKRREASAEKKQSPVAANPRKKRKLNSGSAEPSANNDTLEDDIGDGLRAKTLNLETYKYHSLGDVAPTIRMFGTTDSYSTQIPERFHRYPKMHYKRTSKKSVNKQLSRIQMRQARIRTLRKQVIPEQEEGYIDEDSHMHPYFIGKSQNNPVSLPAFVQTKRNDLAVKGFIPRLKAHLLPRVYQLLLREELKTEGTHGAQSCSSSTSSSEVDRVFFHSDRIYRHQLLHINYTSYNVRRETDIINPKTSRRYIMCLRQPDNEDEETSPHRYVYAQVLGVYHANIIYRGTCATDLRRRRFDFLWVRWFDFLQKSPSTRALDRLQIRPLSHPEAVGFLDPADVMRASYIAPRFSLGKRYSSEDTGRIVSKLANDQSDWREYYVNRFVDRDMLMRHHWGLGIGHIYSHKDAPSAVESMPTDQDSENEPDSEPIQQASVLPDISAEPEKDEAAENKDADSDVVGDDALGHEHSLDDIEGQELDVSEPREDEQEEAEDYEGDDIQLPEDVEDSDPE
ncbi:hypothetical protein DFP72DRAFT_1011401 [Ephemerocybe angulata]|uniref:Uncharacterized protein n=1 Tax=Ephemerocybe angulata TaxID=980116 RepID=A0A8H6HVH7_9AGAR|nr:hypothetical protein DFP72DRAFT_1011401 [Tulosesus angulatus]